MPAARTLDALIAATALGRLPRTGWLLSGVAAPESVAAHSLGAALVALGLGERVDPPLDVQRAAVLALLHDAPEAVLSDIPRAGARGLPPGAKRAAEERAADLVLAPLSETARAAFAEYAAGSTREARFARLCDKLHMGVELVRLARAGSRGLGDFAETLGALDCAEFPPCAELRDEVLAAFARADAGR